MRCALKYAKKNGFFCKKKFYFYFLPIISFALQGLAIYLIVKRELYFQGLFYFVVGWALVLLIVYGPFVVYLIKGCEDINYLGLGDWIIVFLHLPLFIIIFIIALLGLAGKQTLANAPGPSSDGSHKDDRKYHIETEYGTHYVKDEYGNTVDTASVDYSGKGDYKGSDGTIYKKED